MKSQSVMPFLKWVGGKRQLLDMLCPLLPEKMNTYFEPFVGGGALFFAVQPQKAYINDINSELINVYRVIKDNVGELIIDLKKHKNTKEYFYSIRSWDRNEFEYRDKTDIQKASRIIFLNKTCFNGLFRVNSIGEFNTPFGNYKNPNIVNEDVLLAVSRYLNNANIKISSCDYSKLLDKIHENDFVYIDPPYDPISDTANFTGYAPQGFDREEQKRLAKFCEDVDKKGAYFMLSNSATNFIKNLYKKYDIKIVQAKRAINSNGALRGNVDEVIVRNYEKI